MSEHMEKQDVCPPAGGQECCTACREGEYCRIVFEHRKDQAVCLYLPDTTVLQANAEACRLFGKPEQELIGEQWLTFLPEEKHSEVLQMLCDALESGEEIHYERRRIGLSGETEIQEWTDIPVHDEHDKTAWFYSVGRDVTVQRRIALRQKHLQRKLKLLFKYMPDMLVVMQADGTILDVNPTLERQLGCRRNTLIGRHFREICSGESGTDVLRILEEARERRFGTHSLSMQCCDGAVIAAEVSMAAVPWDQSDVLMGVIRNVSALAAGRIHMINILEHRRPFLNKWNEWNKFSENSGGTMIEKCCHYFDLFNLIAESKPVKVYGSGGRDVNFLDFEHDGKRSDIIDNAFAIIDYENGIRACLNLCMFMFCGGAKEQIIVNGEQASIYADDHPGNTLEIKMNGREPSRRINVEAPGGIAEVGGHSGSTYYEHLEFYKAVRNNSSPDVSVEDGYLAVAVGHAVEESIRTGLPVWMADFLN
jgi:PAS domain S-box-containing protein